MGEVYRARDSRLNRDVAIKVLPDALASDADYLARFQREAQVLALMNHPNVEPPDGIKAAALALTISGSGTVRVRTTPLLTVEDVDKALEIKTNYRAPGE